jgi:hypothetical protein
MHFSSGPHGPQHGHAGPPSEPLPVRGEAIFDLDLTAELLETALNVIAQVGGEMTPSLVAVHLRHSQNQGTRC